MAGLVLGKLCFGKDDRQFGLELCLARAGRAAYPITASTVHGCDVLLVTMFWYRDVYQLELFRREAGLERGRAPVVIVGGLQATLTPRAVAGLADYVFVGDADDHLGGILDQIEHGERPQHKHLWDGTGDPPRPTECQPTAHAIGKGGARYDCADPGPPGVCNGKTMPLAYIGTAGGEIPVWIGRDFPLGRGPMLLEGWGDPLRTDIWAWQDGEKEKP